MARSLTRLPSRTHWSRSSPFQKNKRSLLARNGANINSSASASSSFHHHSLYHTQIHLEAELYRSVHRALTRLPRSFNFLSIAVYESFSEVTRRSLVHACAEAQIPLHDGAVSKLMDAYNHLPTYLRGHTLAFALPNFNQFPGLRVSMERHQRRPWAPNAHILQRSALSLHAPNHPCSHDRRHL